MASCQPLGDRQGFGVGAFLAAYLGDETKTHRRHGQTETLLAERESIAMRRFLLNSQMGRNPRGFTLTELMIAVGIIAILATFLAPSVTTYMRRSAGQSAARDMSNMFRTARSQAMSRGEALLVQVTRQDGTNPGRVAILRTTNNALAKCNPADDDYDPHDTDCYALNCTQTSSLTQTQVASLELDETAPDMVISGFDAAPAPAGDTLTLCFSPSGRVLSQTGTPFSSGCDSINTRVFLTEGEPGDATLNNNPLGGTTPALDVCVDTDNHTDDQRQAQKDGRDLKNFFSIHIPYNGAVSVIQ